jgi:hypothetical protein
MAMRKTPTAKPAARVLPKSQEMAGKSSKFKVAMQAEKRREQPDTP